MAHSRYNLPVEPEPKVCVPAGEDADHLTLGNQVQWLLFTREGNDEGDFAGGDFVVPRWNLALLRNDFCLVRKRIATARVSGPR